MTRTILVALDGTSSAEDALPAAAALAAAVSARLLLVQPVPARSYDSGSAPRACRAAQVRTALQAHAARLHARYPFLNLSVAAPIGPWTESVLDEAALEHAELLVADRRLTGATAL